MEPQRNLDIVPYIPDRNEVLEEKKPRGKTEIERKPGKELRSRKAGEEKLEYHEKKREVGLYAILVTILLFLFTNIALSAYWAGGMTRSQENSDSIIRELKDQLKYLQTQNSCSASNN